MARDRSRKTRSDEALLAAVANERDRDAFAELYDRYGSRAYSLARYLCGRAEAAEDAVQSAMLRVWTSAGTFRPGGNPQGWILRVVAREALRQRALTKRHRAKEARELVPTDAIDPDTPETDAEQSDDLKTLRAQIWRLPDEERRIVALYYGCGLTQQEIGEALDVGQNTVSRRLTDAIAALRKALTSAGCAAALPLLADDGLARAVTSGDRVPPALGARIFAGLAKAGAEAAEQSARVAAAKFSWTGPGAVVALCLAAGGAWLAWPKSDTERAGPSEFTAPQAAPVASAGARDAVKPSARVAPFDYRYDFTNSAGEGLRVMPYQIRLSDGFLVPSALGALRWDQVKGLPPGCLLADDELLIDLMPHGIGTDPVEVVAEIYFQPGGKAFFGLTLYQLGAEGMAPRLLELDPTGNLHPKVRKHTQGSVVTTTSYFLDSYTFDFTAGGVMQADRLRGMGPDTRILLKLRYAGILRLRARSLKRDELPEELRDVEGLVKRLTAEQEREKAAKTP